MFHEVYISISKKLEVSLKLFKNMDILMSILIFHNNHKKYKTDKESIFRNELSQPLTNSIFFMHEIVQQARYPCL